MNENQKVVLKYLKNSYKHHSFFQFKHSGNLAYLVFSMHCLKTLDTLMTA